MTIYDDNFVENTADEKTLPAGQRVLLVRTDDSLFHVTDSEGHWLATIQQTVSGWRYYGNTDRFRSRNPFPSRDKAFDACCRSAFLRSLAEGD